MNKRPNETDYPRAVSPYITNVPEGDLIQLLQDQLEQTFQLLGTITGEQEQFRYAPEKWSLREVVGHVIDFERIISYRALRFSRGDIKQLSGFDENDYVRESHYGETPLADLLDELRAVRSASIHLAARFSEGDWSKKGSVEGNGISVLALACSLYGHWQHHMDVITTRYLV
ncbi:DinB family protein [Paenibacillus oenotherae]|uniref:DinB family protein n=1 Tax=Paenibacillus oenotherae TaxID=1435645 RepID=A0ABS7D5Q1_9BACL|nr:DinB family protein [Paenibacillus oenotherae]MBW7475186.1 DinB family protein [Paenibacillus oenotherae]